MTNYSITAAPRFADMQEWDCTRCGRTEVTPVFLTDGNAIAAFGSGCAAVLLGRPRSASRTITTEAAAIQRAADASDAQSAELSEAATRAADDWTAGNFDTADVQRMRRNYHSGRSAGRISGTFPDYILAVAASGNVYPAR